jgi:hypothetical protein
MRDLGSYFLQVHIANTIKSYWVLMVEMGAQVGTSDGKTVGKKSGAVPFRGFQKSEWIRLPKATSNIGPTVQLYIDPSAVLL